MVAVVPGEVLRHLHDSLTKGITFYNDRGTYN